MHPAEDRFTFEDPSSEKSASLVSDGSSFGFSPSARQTSPGSSPPPLPSRIPIALQKDSSLDQDGYLRMVPAEISIPTEQNPLPHPYTTFSVARPRPPPTTARDNPQDSPLLYDKCDHSARSNPFPPPTTARDKPQDSPLVYDKCDHSARYIIPHDMHFQGTYVAQPSKRRSLTEIPPTSDPISPPFTHSEEEEDVARVTDWLSASKPKVDSLERTWTSPSHLHPHPPNYLTILPPSKLPPLPPKKERSPVHEGKSPSPPLARDEIPPVVVQRKGSPSPPPTEGKPHIVPRKTPILERRSTSPIPGEESKPPPVSPRHSRELNLLKTSGMDMRQLGGMERNPVGMESRPEPVGGLGDEPPRPPPRRSTLAVGGSSHTRSINSLDTPIPPPVPSRGNRLSTPPADFDRRGFTYSTPHAISPPPVPPRR